MSDETVYPIVKCVACGGRVTRNDWATENSSLIAQARRMEIALHRKTGMMVHTRCAAALTAIIEHKRRYVFQRQESAAQATA